ncbi:sorbosone dehydrogenase [Devosia limi DSM 17137]|uniref:Glucose/arabinose dehydrogenase, beta-propeller fold n=1 Tax=Devosia limi DSM 17137 TaxID=1121477 RepID=A0A0F5LN57_9HYPH|nr:sorbosone dehydrogenase family protein [Devosia limi]KKB83725.1 sorbosone dehydrogenase [Devosia limi DSM 17137]SHE72635.1 Glucose/arabinose dehydrogenase, beta-propeller fold [Devosia limi DSM 17137]
MTGFLILPVLAALLAGGVWYFTIGRRHAGPPKTPVFGPNPTIPDAHPQGKIPTLKMPTATGWAPGQKPTAAPGLAVTAFAMGLKHPRWAYVLPNGDVLIAESSTLPSKVTGFMDYAMNRVMRRAGAQRESANRITLLRDADGDGVPEVREVFLENLSQPFGMALVGDTFYVGNTDSVVAFPYVEGQTRITAPGRKLTDLKPGGHWTRNLIASKDGRKLYIGVGSIGNIAEGGIELEQDRAAILELDLETNERRVFASGLRNPVGMAWEPTTGSLWTVVNERDGLGDETPPDYLTSVQDGGFYGWPYSYWGKTVDDRVPQDPAMVAKALTPDYALGGHTASLGLCWLPEGTLPGMPQGMVIGQHGSWNRSILSGYKMILVPFVNGRPEGAPIELLTDFLAPDEKTSYGRPVGVTIAKDGSLLLVDDVGDAVWRVTGAAGR